MQMKILTELQLLLYRLNSPHLTLCTFNIRSHHRKNQHPFQVYPVLLLVAPVVVLIPQRQVVPPSVAVHRWPSILPIWVHHPHRVTTIHRYKCHNRIHNNPDKCNRHNIYKGQLYDTTLCGVADSARRYRRKTNGYNISRNRSGAKASKRHDVTMSQRQNVGYRYCSGVQTKTSSSENTTNSHIQARIVNCSRDSNKVVSHTMYICINRYRQCKREIAKYCRISRRRHAAVVCKCVNMQRFQKYIFFKIYKSLPY